MQISMVMYSFIHRLKQVFYSSELYINIYQYPSRRLYAWLLTVCLFTSLPSLLQTTPLSLKQHFYAYGLAIVFALVTKLFAAIFLGVMALILAFFHDLELSLMQALRIAILVLLAPSIVEFLHNLCLAPSILVSLTLMFVCYACIVFIIRRLKMLFVNDEIPAQVTG